MARKELKALTFDEFAGELLEEKHPRSLVLLSSAQIDIQLFKLLEMFLRPKVAGPNQSDELLEGDTPLGAFSARIKAAFRLGIVDGRLASNLHQFREIRNQAAHWVSFGIAESPLKDQAKALHMALASRKSYALTVKRFFNVEPDNDFKRLKAALLTLSVLLETIYATMPERSLDKIQKAPKFD